MRYCKKNRKKVTVVISLPFNRKKSITVALCFLSLNVCKVPLISFHDRLKSKVTNWSTKFRFFVIKK